MRSIDFESWQTILTSLVGLAIVTLTGVGIRVLMMQTIQQRRERMNRQINERLKTLISAYRTLGGSFTGQLTVDPTHLRELRMTERGDVTRDDQAALPRSNSERARRIRDAVEAALSDIILLGTEEHVRLASQAALDMAAGRPVETAVLVVSLRNFIRTALDLGPVPADVAVPLQGPARIAGSAARPKNEAAAGGAGGAKQGAQEGGAGMGLGMATGLGVAHDRHDQGDEPPR